MTWPSSSSVTVVRRGGGYVPCVFSPPLSPSPPFSSPVAFGESLVVVVERRTAAARAAAPRLVVVSWLVVVVVVDG